MEVGFLLRNDVVFKKLYEITNYNLYLELIIDIARAIVQYM